MNFYFSVTETSSSSESSSVSSDTSSDSEDDSELGDTKLLLEIRNKLKHIETKTNPIKDPDPNIIPILKEDEKIGSPLVENPLDKVKHKEQVQKRKREGLVQEIIISVSCYLNFNYTLVFKETFCIKRKF